MSIQEDVGKQVRLFRKNRGMSLEQLASKIYRSKSIISKYELGQANMDIQTLYDISEALGVSPSDLLNSPDIFNTDISGGRYGIFRENLLYIYILGTISRKKYAFQKSVLSFEGGESDQGVRVTLYGNVSDLKHYETCKFVCKGFAVSSPYNISIVLKNIKDESDHITILAPIRRTCEDVSPAMFCSYSLMDITPCSAYAVISRIPLKENEYLEEILRVSKHELSLLKNGNVFVGREIVDEAAIVDKKK